MTHIYTAYREFDVKDRQDVISSGEIRYRFSVKPGRDAVTWINADVGFAPAERPTVDVTEVAIRTHHSHPWRILEGVAFDAFSADVADEWFVEQIEVEA